MIFWNWGRKLCARHFITGKEIKKAHSAVSLQAFLEPPVT
jgi:hypothetical protein